MTRRRVVYFVAHLPGGAVAGVAFKFLSVEDKVIQPGTWEEQKKAA